jgi:hypothetical protein
MADDPLADLYWRCHICGELRPDDKIRVFRTDISEEHGMPIGTIQQNVRYCEDRPECVIKAQTHRLFKRP